MIFTKTKWILKRDIANQITYFNPATQEWTDYQIFVRLPIELLHNLKYTLFPYEPIVRYDTLLDEWTHEPHWNDDRYPLDIKYTIMSIV